MKLLYFFLLPSFFLFSDVDSSKDSMQEPIQNEEVTPESTPIIISQDAYKKDFYNTLLALVGIVVIALISILFIKRFGKNRIFQMNSSKNIKVLEQRFISPNTALFHIQVGDKQFIVSESKLEVKFITHLDWDQKIDL
jgi:flagellar biogenesis protein FliO